MENEAGHVRRLVNRAHVAHLHEVHEEPEGNLLVAVVHESRSDEVHALHVANGVVVVGEGGEDALQPVVIWILIQVRWRVADVDAVDAERHLQESGI